MADTYLNAAQRGGTGPNGLTSLTIDEAAAQLTRSAVSWGYDWGTAATVSYAYRAYAPGSMPEDTAGFSRFNSAQIAATELALQSWSDVANITFVRVGSGTSGSGAYSNSATILLGNYSSGMDGAAAFTYFPGSTAYSSFDGDLWVNNSYSYNANPTFYDYGQLVLVHELGHAIGLDHPGDYNAGPGVDITYSNSAAYFEDSMQYSVMSYFYETYTGADYGYYYPATIMLDDIAAAQRLYGANMSTRTGDTTYGFHSNSGRAWFTANVSSDPLIFAVWDAGGTDTFDFSGYASNQKIDLGAGNFSNVGGLIGNVAIAKGVTIENAIGGAGADTIIGNAAANRLQGNAGADTLTGGAGADVFVVTTGGGADVIKDFAVGTDKIDATAYGAYQSIVQSGANTVITFATGVTETLQNVTASTVTNDSFIGLTAPPTPTGDQTINGTSAGETLLGGSGNDTLNGYGGADTLDGKTGADAMYGGLGDDTYYVDNPGDTVHENAGEGADSVHSTISFALSNNVETLILEGTGAINATGNALNNTLSGNDADNVLDGGAGNDTLGGAAGADTLKGGLGNDTYYIYDTNDVVVETAGQGTDTVFTAVSLTLSANVERLKMMGKAALDATGNDIDNLITGNSAANTIHGEGGNDRLEGGPGDDRLYGDAGADTLTGGDGADVFVVTTGGGNDVIQDFQVGIDKIDATAYGAYQSIVQSGSNTVITFATGVTETLQNVTASTVTSSSFIGLGAAPPPPSTGDQTINGTSAGETLLGGSGNDTLNGYGGADTLDGKTGADAMYGGLGDDTYYVDNPGDTVHENAGEGADTVHSTISFALSNNVETLVLEGTGAINATGNALNNTLSGNDADNVLDGGAGNDTLGGAAGADTLKGGLGNDTYYIYDTNDVVVEAAGQGTDTVFTAVSLTLSANVERLKMMGKAALDATGNDIDNLITGNSAANTIHGEGGNDRLEGGLGDDRLYGDAGADTLTGGDGADVFVYQALSESTVSASDRIVDFAVGTDHIDLSAIDANTAVSGDQAFALVGAFDHHAGQAVLTYDGVSTTTLTLDVNGDAVADFSLLISGHLTDGGGFIL